MVAVLLKWAKWAKYALGVWLVVLDMRSLRIEVGAGEKVEL